MSYIKLSTNFLYKPLLQAIPKYEASILGSSGEYTTLRPEAYLQDVGNKNNSIGRGQSKTKLIPVAIASLHRPLN